jgi:hypothetical protein
VSWVFGVLEDDVAFGLTGAAVLPRLPPHDTTRAADARNATVVGRTRTITLLEVRRTW